MSEEIKHCEMSSGADNFSEDETYLLQNGYCGNDIVFWKKGRAGYTTNIDNAHRFTKKEAFCQHRMRNEDKPWPLSVVLCSSRQVVDHQDIGDDLRSMAFDSWDKPTP